MSVTITESIKFSEGIIADIKGNDVVVKFVVVRTMNVVRARGASSFTHLSSGATSTSAWRVLNISKEVCIHLHNDISRFDRENRDFRELDAYARRRHFFQGKQDKPLHSLRWVLPMLLRNSYTMPGGEKYEFVFPEEFEVPEYTEYNMNFTLSHFARAELHKALGDEATDMYVDPVYEDE